MNATQKDSRNTTVPSRPELRKDARFYLGLFFFILAWVSPLFIPVILQLPLSSEAKGTLSTLLLVGAPEVFILIAAALLGKETLAYFVGRIKSVFRMKRPFKPVGRVRYTIGLLMFLACLLSSVVEVNYPPAREIYGDYFTEAAIVWNIFFVVSLFVLGGNFWDKLRSLFVFDAYAVFPAKPEADHETN